MALPLRQNVPGAWLAWPPGMPRLPHSGRGRHPKRDRTCPRARPEKDRPDHPRVRRRRRRHTRAVGAPREHARRGFDAGRIVLWGSSAGAHLSALLALKPGMSNIVGVIDWFGPADLLALGSQSDPHNEAAEDSCEARLLGARPAAVPEMARAASPINHVHGASPPFLIAHGTADRHVPFQQSADLAHALEKAGATVRFDSVEGADHMWANVADPEPLFRTALRFAAEVTGL
ncbi:prolyl oligopeptidase family serine peptidase [Streptomyces sp. R35]|uniref:Prolyl oligopeptidase family serine peptidase n=1 Tax=Streptomyces sp. R35 TaxID=3238630 RepID=A0AB39SLB3_9ACTN